MLKITTNGHVREMVTFEELPADAQGWFDYLDPDDARDTPRFLRAYGSWYDVADMLPTGNDELNRAGWDGYQSESYWSGVVVRFPGKDWDHVVVGRYMTDD